MKTVTPEEIEEQNAHVQELRRVRNLFPRYRTQKNLGIPMKTVTPEEIIEDRASLVLFATAQRQHHTQGE